MLLQHHKKFKIFEEEDSFELNQDQNNDFNDDKIKQQYVVYSENKKDYA
jgi:hypothetical protein